MTQEQKPVLLSEAEAEAMWGGTYASHAMSLSEYLTELQRRGLFQTEPADPLLGEVREICREMAGTFPKSSGAYERPLIIARGDGDGYYETKLMLAALKRGREMGLAEREYLIATLEEARTSLSITRINIKCEIGRCADPDESRWAGVPEALAERIAHIDAAIAKARGAQ